MHKAVLYGISENVASIVQVSKYGAINADNPTTIGYYVISHPYEPYIIKDDQPQMGK